MSNLSPEQILTFTTKLNELKRDLKERLQNSQEDSKPVALDQPIGRLTRMDAIQQQKMAQAKKTRLKIRLQQTEEALRRIQKEIYGECPRCEEPISMERLIAHPETPFCIHCQKGRE